MEREGRRKGQERVENLHLHFQKDLTFYLDSLKLLLKRPKELHEMFK